MTTIVHFTCILEKKQTDNCKMGKVDMWKYTSLSSLNYNAVDYCMRFLRHLLSVSLGLVCKNLKLYHPKVSWQFNTVHLKTVFKIPFVKILLLLVIFICLFCVVPHILLYFHTLVVLFIHYPIKIASYNYFKIKDMTYCNIWTTNH